MPRAPKRTPEQEAKHTVGSTKYGAPGGNPGGIIDICSFALSQNFARIYGCSLEDAYRSVLAMGLAAHQLLMRGEPIGLPHVGVIYIGRKLCTSYMGPKKGSNSWDENGLKKGYVSQAPRRDGLVPRGFEPAARFRSPYLVNCLRIFMPRNLREYMQAHMPRNGTKKQQVARARERFRTVLRRTHKGLKNGEIAHKPRQRAMREHRKRLALL